MIIEYLPASEYKDYIVPIGYTTEEYYDVAVTETELGFSVSMAKKAFAKPVTHTPEENNFPDKLYAEYWEKAEAYGAFENGELIGIIEICPEEWSNRLRVTELWVSDRYHRQGVGRSLMNVAKQRAEEQSRRAIILETQSCNVNAIGFYIHEGFTLIGFDACCYANNDLDRKEVRIEMAYLR